MAAKKPTPKKAPTKKVAAKKVVKAAPSRSSSGSRDAASMLPQNRRMTALTITLFVLSLIFLAVTYHQYCAAG